MSQYQFIGSVAAMSLKWNMQPITFRTIGSLPYWDAHVDASQKVRELLSLLDRNAHVAGVLVLEHNKLIGLIPREMVYEKLGRPFGVELFLKTSNKHFYKMLGVSTLVLSANTPIDEAVKKALTRDKEVLYEPIVVEHADGYRIISMYALLMAQQNTLRDLYSEVRHLSTKDPLTLVNNRRGFAESVEHLMETIRQFNLEYAVLILDIDKFKQINDRYGHLVGDDVLKSLARQIATHIREKDVLGRFGGEEFLVFLSNISKESACNLAEKLREEIAGFFHTINGFQIHITVSIGVSHSKGTKHTLDRLFAEADEALYAAKNTGRNKVVLWKEKLSQSRKGRKLFRKARNDLFNQREQVFNETLHGLLHMLYLRDYETEAHTQRVAELSLNLAKKLGIPKEQHEGIRIGALLHDIGKIAIPDKILFKQAELTSDEWAIMQKHPEHARDLLLPISYFQNALDIPYCHHEHWDGKGYPRGLRAEEIPLSARIFTIVDVWDALTSDRPYRPAWKKKDVKDYLIGQSGILFDPALVPLFLKSLGKSSD